MAQNVGCEQFVDLEEAERFLTWLDPQAERFTFQTFSDGGKDAHLAKVHHLPPDQLGPLVRLNGRKRAVAGAAGRVTNQAAAAVWDEAVQAQGRRASIRLIG